MNTNPITSCIGAFTLLMLLFVVLLTQNKADTLKFKLFKAIIYMILFAIVTEALYFILATLLSDKTFIINGVLKLHWLSGVFVYYISYYYIKSYFMPQVKSFKEFSKDGQNIILKMLLILACLLYILLPSNIFNENNDVLFIQGYSVFFIVGIIFIILVRIQLIYNKYGDKEDKFLKSYIVYLWLESIASFIIQLFFPTIAILAYGMVYFVYILYYTIENPDNYIIKELEKIKTSLEENSNSKTKMLYNLSEEFNKPIGAIIKECKKASKNNAEKVKVDESLNKIIQNGKGLIEIINNLVESSATSETEKMDVYSIVDILTEIENEYEYKLENKNVHYELNISPNTPSKFYGNVDKIRNIIRAIVSTAIKDTEYGKIIVNIKCYSSNNKGDLTIEVIDTGNGIKEENLNNIFNSAKNDYSNVGLSIAHKYVEQLGGTIKINSTYLAGTIVNVSITQIIRDYSPVNLEQKNNKTDKLVVNNYKQQKLLIVDEDPLNRKVIKNMLEPYNFIVEEAVSGIDCLNRIKSDEKYSLILIDHQMDGLDGPQVLTALIKLKQFFEIPPVIMVTANAAPGTREKYLSDGFDEYISKPISAKELNRIINGYVKLKDQRGYEVNEMKFDTEDETKNYRNEETNESISNNPSSVEEINEQDQTSEDEIPQSVELTEISFKDIEHKQQTVDSMVKDPNKN